MSAAVGVAVTRQYAESYSGQMTVVVFTTAGPVIIRIGSIEANAHEPRHKTLP